MLKQLSIQNLILIDAMMVSFDKGLNIITGETGSGKSAVMSALKLITGARAETAVIRKGCTKAVVEALFDIEAIPEVVKILESYGIDCEPGEALIIKREISCIGKGRTFINNQMAQVSVLRQLGSHLLEIVGQHANQRLFDVEEHRNILDLFGGLEKERKSFEDSWLEEKKSEERLAALRQGEAKRLRDIERSRSELDELEEAALKDGEEEELFAEYALLANSEELTRKAEAIAQLLSNDESAALPILGKGTGIFESLAAIDPSLQEQCDTYHSCILELKEIAYSIDRYAAAIDSNPLRLEEVNRRLSLINKIKRKYGPSFEDIRTYQRSVEQRLEECENADEEIEQLEIKLQKLKALSNEKASHLSAKRREAAKHFSEAMTIELKELNMPKVAFEAMISQQQRSFAGDDRVEYCIAPNVGERLIPVKECASGGEISRLLLALHTLLASRNRIPTLIFDEVDANIGGETATIVGKKLMNIGSSHQVICITHFAQVARQADYHLQIVKKENCGRTVSQVNLLDFFGREREIQRMLGELSSV